MVYVANWGTHRLMLRLPEDLADKKALAAYCPGESMTLESTRTGVVVDFNSDMEDFAEWEEGQGWMERLSPLRADLLRGDLRAPCLGWLMCAQNGELDDDVLEPPVPPGLGTLSKPLCDLAEYLRVDVGLVAAAAEYSPAPAAPATGVEDWIAGREEQLWQRVQELLSASHRRGYDEAAAALNNLHDLAQRDARLEDFRARLAGLYDRHRGKKAFWGRLSRLKAML